MNQDLHFVFKSIKLVDEFTEEFNEEFELSTKKSAFIKI